MVKIHLHPQSKGKLQVKISNSEKWAIRIYRWREILRPLGKRRSEFIEDVRRLYSAMRQQEYEDQGASLPASELLNLGEEKTLSKYVYQLAHCLQPPLRHKIHVFNLASSKPLKETIYDAFVQGKHR